MEINPVRRPVSVATAKSPCYQAPGFRRGVLSGMARRVLFQAYQAFGRRGPPSPVAIQTLIQADHQVADDFRATVAGERYAKALFELSNESNRQGAVLAHLRALKAAYGESADLRRLVASPVWSAEDKQRGLLAIADAAKFDPTTRKFLGLLASNHRAAELPAVIADFERLHADHVGTVAAEVTSAKALDSAQLDSIRSALRQSLGRDPELETRVDPSILGGLKVRVGSRLFDASLRTKLDQMKFALKRA